METPKTTPQIQDVVTVKDSEYRDAYTNNINITISLWDFFFTFGRMKHTSNQVVTTTVFQGIYMSPQQAKALANILVENVKSYEDAFGPIKLVLKDLKTQ